jgi:hypothetical protein
VSTSPQARFEARHDYWRVVGNPKLVRRRIRRSAGTCEQQQPGAVRLGTKNISTGDLLGVVQEAESKAEASSGAFYITGMVPSKWLSSKCSLPGSRSAFFLNSLMPFASIAQASALMSGSHIFS